MSDVKLEWNGSFFDPVLEKNDIALDDGLRTAVTISLFSDRRIKEEELPDGDTDKRGWWGDQFADIEGDLTGSRLWLLKREKQTNETRRRAEEFANEALQWLVTDGVAQGVSSKAEWLGGGFLGLAVSIQRPQGKLTFTYKINWNAETVRNDGL